MRSRIIILSMLLIWLPCFELLAQAQAEEIAQLEKGKVLVRTEEDPVTKDEVSVGKVIFPASFETSWKVLTDYVSWSKFLSEVREVKIEKKDGNQIWLRLRLANFWPFPDYNLLVLVEESKASGMLSFEMKEGDFTKYYGRWKLVPIKTSSEQEQTLAEYRFFQYIGWWWFPFLPKSLTNNSIVAQHLRDFRKQINETQIEDSLKLEKVIQPFWKKSLFKEREKEEKKKLK